ncbi:hypothetical protein HXX76_006147 [Chlamydomonas incerta]|uniref:CBM20 domain-containing protein n=1 Tax=Chlamydomonas incerta TaxID=51695 RepID=A0A835T2A6_CHLIN|nr:hypothetical protein HXX76_006147 [Chlamydomonas incerta]|eukprot:KAG2437498.1 hypothetical protein HXX76_006147 [Chlamydomonas incerta]
MKWTSGDQWTCTVALPAGSSLECKYIVVDERTGREVRWQEGGNMLIAVPANVQGLPVEQYETRISWCKQYSSFKAHPLTSVAAAAAGVTAAAAAAAAKSAAPVMAWAVAKGASAVAAAALGSSSTATAVAIAAPPAAPQQPAKQHQPQQQAGAPSGALGALPTVSASAAPNGLAATIAQAAVDAVLSASLSAVATPPPGLGADAKGADASSGGASRFQLTPASEDEPLTLTLLPRSTSPPLKLSLSSSYSQLMEMTGSGSGSSSPSSGSPGTSRSSSSTNLAGMAASGSGSGSGSPAASSPAAPAAAAPAPAATAPAATAPAATAASASAASQIRSHPIEVRCSPWSEPLSQQQLQQRRASSAASSSSSTATTSSSSSSATPQPKLAQKQKQPVAALPAVSTASIAAFGAEYDMYASLYDTPYMHTAFDLDAYAMYDTPSVPEPASAASSVTARARSPLRAASPAAAAASSSTSIFGAPAGGVSGARSDPLESAVQAARSSSPPKAAAAAAPAAAAPQAAAAALPAYNSIFSDAPSPKQPAAAPTASAATAAAAASTDGAAAASYRSISRSGKAVSEWAGRTIFTLSSASASASILDAADSDSDDDEDDVAEVEARVAHALDAPVTAADMAALLRTMGTALGHSVRMRHSGVEPAAADLLELDRQIALQCSKLYRQRDNLLVGFVRHETARRQLAPAPAATGGGGGSSSGVRPGGGGVTPM